MERKERLLVSLGICLVLLFLAWDIWDDLHHGSGWRHVTGEMVAFTFGMAGLRAMWIKFLHLKKENIRVRSEIVKARQDMEEYKKETAHLVKGMNEKIQWQLNKWELSAAEKDVCLLLLKGMSSKEIATARDTSEKTISLHLTNIYQKSRLQGRSELFAFFLEDLFTE